MREDAIFLIMKCSRRSSSDSLVILSCLLVAYCIYKLYALLLLLLLLHNGDDNSTESVDTATTIDEDKDMILRFLFLNEILPFFICSKRRLKIFIFMHRNLRCKEGTNATHSLCFFVIM